MNRVRPMLSVAAVVGVTLFALLTMTVHIGAGAPLQFIVLEATLGALFVLAGAIAWLRRPESLTGPILTASGFIWFGGGWAATGIEPYVGLAFSFERYYDILLAFLALTFPGRRVASRTASAVLVVLGAAYLVRSAVRLLLIAGFTNEQLFVASETWTSVVAVAAALAVAALAAFRAMRASPAAARVLRPVALAGTVAALSAAYDNAELAYGHATGLPLNSLTEPWAEAFTWTLFGFVALVPLGFLVGTLRLRLQHGAIAPLALELDRSADPARLELALAHALGDPSLRLYVRDRDSDSWIDSAGVAASLPAEQDGRALTRLERDGLDLAAIVHDEALREDPALVGAATAVLRLAMDNDRLTADVRAQLDEVRASRTRIIEAAQHERTRIERDLHDGAQQRLLSVALMLQQATTAARESAPEASYVRTLDETAEELKSAIDELRELARGIHPAVLTEEGLGVAATALARRSSVPVELDISLDRRLPPAVEATGYYVVAEALTNVSRHSRASSARVTIRLEGDALSVEVADDGDGGAEMSGGTGLRGLADRLDAINGRLDIGVNEGGGTRLRAVIPCA